MFSLVSYNKPRDMSAPIIMVKLYKRYRAVVQTINQMGLIRTFGKFLIAKICVFNSTTTTDERIAYSVILTYCRQ